MDSDSDSLNLGLDRVHLDLDSGAESERTPRPIAEDGQAAWECK